jgi:hypothetical protein
MRNFSIIIDEYKDSKIYDVFLSDGNKSLETIQGLNFFAATNQIDKFIIRYDLQKTDLITNNVYDENGYLLYTDQETLDEYARI